MNMAAASQATSFLGIMPIVAILVTAFTLFRWNRRCKIVGTARLDHLNREIEALQDRILLVSTDSVPDQPTLKTIGYLESLSGIEAASDSDYRLAEQDALLKLVRNAQAQGANAIVGLRKTHAHYDQPGSQWRVSRVLYSGTAVVVM